VAEKYPFKTKRVIAKSVLAASFLAPREQMQVSEILPNKNNLAPNIELIHC
jgi:hypothetical protein